MNECKSSRNVNPCPFRPLMSFSERFYLILTHLQIFLASQSDFGRSVCVVLFPFFQDLIQKRKTLSPCAEPNPSRSLAKNELKAQTQTHHTKSEICKAGNRWQRSDKRFKASNHQLFEALSPALILGRWKSTFQVVSVELSGRFGDARTLGPGVEPPAEKKGGQNSAKQSL